ncbi:hypothetical protein [Ensifer sp. ENS08]|uniref:hypothetical protein n=1 Tax=Ensifer sp. ENS08 TaxID=2769273 RepID=UPI00177D1CB6|nr:hypothetical protein [Ensifer sp. ENS08]MBD9573432.1 hypothetical protein [Ensifer sp. ENS08]
MRYIVTPDFSKTVISTPEAIPTVGNFIRLVEGSTKDELLSHRHVSVVADGVLYTFQEDGTKIFFSFGTDDSGEYLLAADLVALTPASPLQNPSPRARDPQRDRSVNPNHNFQINPKHNIKLNPKYNTQLNPKYNVQINPKYNTQINPRYNSRINYKLNPSINPRLNPSIDPQRNWSINPSRNKALPGPFIYDLRAKQEGFTVKASDSVVLIFSMSAVLRRIAVENGIGGYVVFDLDNVWREHWVRHPSEGYLCFSEMNEWVGFVVN